jgi:hypothetical protein
MSPLSLVYGGIVAAFVTGAALLDVLYPGRRPRPLHSIAQTNRGDDHIDPITDKVD